MKIFFLKKRNLFLFVSKKTSSLYFIPQSDEFYAMIILTNYLNNLFLIIFSIFESNSTLHLGWWVVTIRDGDLSPSAMVDLFFNVETFQMKNTDVNGIFLESWWPEAAFIFRHKQCQSLRCCAIYAKLNVSS